MEYNGSNLDSGKDVANAFAQYFSSVYVNYVTEPSARAAMTGPCLEGVSCLPPPEVREHDVKDAIKRLKSKCTTGPDLIPQYLIKGCSDILIKPLTFMYNLSLISNTFPEKWKITKVTPIHKSGRKSQIMNYRPVAVLSVPAKIFEMIIYKSLYAHAKKYISTAQHGFVTGKSVITNLLNFTGYVSSGLDSGIQTDALFLDLAKAFDKVDHSILLKKLHFYGISPGLLEFFKSYIVNRKQFIFYHGFVSPTFNVESGVPQGSNLGPCLFTLLINDLSKYIRYSKALLFADDLKLFKHIRNNADTAELQYDLEGVAEWSSINKMSFNVSKCQVMTFTRSQDYICNNYFLNDLLISRVNQVKDLGVHIDSMLSFNAHIDTCIASASKIMGFIMRQSINFKSIKTLIFLYNSLVRSRLESSAIVWNPIHKTYQDALEKVQKRFLRFLFFKCFNVYTYEVPYDELLELFGFRRLGLRRDLMSLMFLYKLVHNEIDDPASLEVLAYRTPNFNSRSRTLFSLPFTRTSAHASTPLYRVMRSYNMILSKGCDIDIFHNTKSLYKSKCLIGLSI